MRVNVEFRARSNRHMDKVDHRIRLLAGKSPVSKWFCCSDGSISLAYTFAFRNTKSGMDFLRRANRIRYVQAEIVT